MILHYEMLLKVNTEIMYTSCIQLVKFIFITCNIRTDISKVEAIFCFFLYVFQWIRVTLLQELRYLVLICCFKIDPHVYIII